MPIDNDLLLVLRSAELAPVEPDLGQKLTRAFLTQLLETGHLPGRIVCMGTAIFLTTDGSPVLDLLEKFVAAGTQIASCGTCLDYYGRREKLRVGAVGNMKDTAEAMATFPRVMNF